MYKHSNLVKINSIGIELKIPLKNSSPANIQKYLANNYLNFEQSHLLH